MDTNHSKCASGKIINCKNQKRRNENHYPRLFMFIKILSLEKPKENPLSQSTIENSKTGLHAIVV